MEESATTAIYTGAFLMIFISSLTIALFLFNNIVDLSEVAYQFNTNISSNQTIVNVPVGENLLLSAEEVASYYYNYVVHDLYIGEDGYNKDYEIKIYLPSNPNAYPLTKDDLKANSRASSYQSLMGNLDPENNSYILSYDSVDTRGIIHISIRPATDAQKNATY